jgi:hypothetical protein
VPRQLFDVAEEPLLGGGRRLAEQSVQSLQKRVGFPGPRAERLVLQLPAKVLRPWPDAATQREQGVEQVAQRIAGVHVAARLGAEAVGL